MGTQRPLLYPLPLFRRIMLVVKINFNLVSNILVTELALQGGRYCWGSFLLYWPERLVWSYEHGFNVGATPTAVPV